MKLAQQLQLLVISATVVYAATMTLALSVAIPGELIPLERQRQREILSRYRLTFENYVQTIHSDLRAAAGLSHSKTLLSELQAQPNQLSHEAEQKLIRPLQVLMEAKANCIQLRLISSALSGHELLRLERKRAGTPVFLRDRSKLQRKGHRPYVQAGAALKPGAVHISPIDLNYEHGKVQLPPLPVVRAVTPLCDNDGRCPAMIVLNVDMGPVLKRLSGIRGLRAVNRDGSFLVHDNAERLFASDLGHDYRLQTTNATLAKQLLKRSKVDPNWSVSYRSGDTLIATLPLSVGETIAGFLILTAPAHSAHVEAIARTTVLSVSCVLGILVVLASWLLARSLSRPLTELTVAAREVGPGDSFILPPKLSGETRVLGEALQGLLSTIEQQNAEVLQFEQRFRQIFEASPTGLIVADLHGNILMANHAVETIFGYGNDELASKTITDLVPNTLHKEADASRQTDDPQGQRKDGSYIALEIGLSPVTLPHGVATLAAISDISERRQVSEELLRSNAELDRFAAIVSHDLQEPVRVVMLYAQLLERGDRALLSDSGKHHLDTIQKSASRMRTLISDLRAYSRVNSGPLQRTALDTTAIVHEACELLAASLEEAHASVDVAQLPRVRGDHGLVRQVFQNLIGNAAKFRGAQPTTIKIRGHRRGPRVFIEVEDNGIGLSEGQAERMFEIFQRLQSSDKYPGSGIGLSIVKRVVERHGGRVTVASTPGHGATFSFDLPAT